MAISQTVLTNRLDKKINYGKARTAFDAQKGPLNEAIASPLSQSTHQLWVQSEQIPALAPTTTTSIVQVYQYAASGTSGIIEMTKDPTVSSDRAYLACGTNSDVSTLLGGWIPTTFGATYDAKFYIGAAGNHGNTDWSGLGFTQIFPATSGEEWYFDYDSGVFAFAGGSIPSGLSGNALYMTKGFKYAGTIGLSNFVNPNSVVSLNDCFNSEFNIIDNTLIVIMFSLEACVIPNGENHIANINYYIPESVDLGQNIPLEFGNTIVSDQFGNEIPSAGESGSILVGMVGDINGDGQVNVSDIVLAVSFAISSQTPTPYQLWAGDVNDDGMVNVLDIVTIVNIILN